MIQLVFSLAGIFLIIAIFLSKDEKKLQFYLAGFLFFPITVFLTNQPFNIPITRLLFYSLFFSLFIQGSSFKKEFKEFPLYSSLMYLLISLMLIGILDSRLGIVSKIFRPFTLFLENYFLIFLSYYALKDEKKIFNIYKILFYSFGIITLYGVFNIVTSSNPFHELIANTYSTRNIAEDYIYRGDRTRITSFIYHPILYGLVLSIMGMFLIFSLNEKKIIIFKNIKKLFQWTLLALIFLNLIFTHSRTPQIAFLLGIITLFTSFFLDKKNIVKVIASIFLLIATVQIPIVQETSERLLDIFKTGGEAVQGSSIMMRERQLFASYVLFQQSPIVGNGIRYITEDLGWSLSKEDRLDTGDLKGFESFVFKLLIEQGLIGIVANAIFFISLFMFHLKNYWVSKNRSLKHFIALHMGLIILYLSFIIGTGDLNSMPFFFSLMGLSIKYQILSKNNPRNNAI